MQIAAMILGVTILGGLVLAGIRLSGAKHPPTWMALGHGAIAVAGLGFLIHAAVTTTVPVMAQASLATFVLAAVGGVTIFLVFHMRDRPLPLAFVFGHGAVAVAGMGMLLTALYG